MLQGHQSTPSLHRIAANGVEALIGWYLATSVTITTVHYLLGAVYLEKGLEKCQILLTKLLFWDDEVSQRPNSYKIIFQGCKYCYLCE